MSRNIAIHPIETRGDLWVWRVGVSIFHTMQSILAGGVVGGLTGIAVMMIWQSELLSGIVMLIVGILVFSLAFCYLVIDWVWRGKGITKLK